MVGISIIICCYNSSERISETLKFLANQKFDNKPWEVIIVNNNSTDATSLIAKSEWLKYSLKVPMLVVDEPSPGLNNAREKGIKTASYEILLFCDDDNWLNPDYLSIGYTILEGNSKISALGGKGEPVFETNPPAWFKEIESSFALGKQNSESGDISKTRKFVYGAGMFLRKSSWEFIKSQRFPNLVSDRKGDILISGGDNEICFCLVIAGYKIWYDERLTFKHLMPAKRIQKSYVERLYKGFGTSSFLLRPYYFYFQPIKRKVNRLAWLRDIFYVLKHFLPSLFQVSLQSRNKPGRYKKYLECLSTWEFIKRYVENYKLNKKNIAVIESFSHRVSAN